MSATRTSRNSTVNIYTRLRHYSPDAQNRLFLIGFFSLLTLAAAASEEVTFTANGTDYLVTLADKIVTHFNQTLSSLETGYCGTLIFNNLTGLVSFKEIDHWGNLVSFSRGANQTALEAVEFCVWALLNNVYYWYEKANKGAGINWGYIAKEAIIYGVPSLAVLAIIVVCWDRIRNDITRFCNRTRLPVQHPVPIAQVVLQPIPAQPIQAPEAEPEAIVPSNEEIKSDPTIAQQRM